MVTAVYGDRSSEVCGGEVVESLNARSAMGAVSPGTARATTMFAMSAEGAEKSWSKQEDSMTNETYTPDDRAATKPLVDAACKWCEAYDNWWRTVGDKPYDEQLSSMEIAALNYVKAACREVYEASKTKGEEE